MKNYYTRMMDDLLDDDMVVGEETFDIDSLRFEDCELHRALKSEKEQTWRDQ